MAEVKGRFGNAGFTVIDGLLLALCSVCLSYLSLPFLAKASLALGNSAEPDPHADIKMVSVIVFLGVFLLGTLAVFCASFGLGYLILAKLPGRGRLFARIGMAVLLLPVFFEAVRADPQAYLGRLMNPAVRESQERQRAKSELQRRLKASGVLSVQRETDGLRVSNHSDQLVRVQVEFISRSGEYIVQCSPSQSGTFPPSPTDEQMNLPAGETRLYLFSDARPIVGTLLPCGFEDYRVSGWDEKGVPVYLSEKAFLRGAP